MEDSNLRQIRLEKLAKLKEKGIDPYPASTHRTHTITEALKSEGKKVATAGRMTSFREHGNIAFADIKDENAKIQIFFQKKLLGDDAFKNLRLLDIGDFIQVEGDVVRTVAGEISIAPTSYTLLTKSLLPLPNDWYGLKDSELRLRKRYLDLLMHSELRNIFKKKTLFWQVIREYLIEKGFIEVETPVLQQIPGGADARPFITYHNAQDMDLYLRISLELPLKRLLVGGFEKVFEIGRIFRNEGIDDEHLQDYTQLEFYWAYADYNELMGFIEDMYKGVIMALFGKLQTEWKGNEINWDGKWPRIEYTDLLNKEWGVKTEDMTIEELYELSRKLHIFVEPNLGKGRILDYLYKKTIRPKLLQPMFIINHPVEVEPLAKRVLENDQNVQRMQVLAMGSELGKGFSELNDPLDQRERFEEQMKLREAGDEEAQMMDEDYVEALEYGMPPAAGFGISERLFAMLMDRPVREMVFFPTMKPEANKEKEKKISPKKTNSEQKDKISDTQDFSKRFVVVLNKELPSWQAMNALGHMSAFLGNKMDESFDTGEAFIAKDSTYPRNSQYPIIVASAKPGQLANLLDKVKTSGLLYHVFIREMIETTNDKEIEMILATKESKDIEILGIGIFGPNEAVEKLTKNYSLWK
ncbi:MAG: lysine--tRNA ligase [Candidatus Levybacteria bacterium]|nr:lysine--tRNA ligase [Candidatus Levybacteria bacterium]